MSLFAAYQEDDDSEEEEKKDEEELNKILNKKNKLKKEKSKSSKKEKHRKKYYSSSSDSEEVKNKEQDNRWRFLSESDLKNGISSFIVDDSKGHTSNFSQDSMSKRYLIVYDKPCKNVLGGKEKLNDYNNIVNVSERFFYDGKTKIYKRKKKFGDISNREVTNVSNKDYAKESILETKETLLKEAVNNNPQDTDSWLDLINFQDEICTFRGDGVKAICERKISMIDEALKKLGKKGVELKVKKLECLSKMGDFNLVIKQWNTYLIQHPNSLMLWQGIINIVLYDFNNFTVSLCLRVIGDCFDTLTRLLRNEIVSHKVEEGTEKFLGDLLCQLINLHFQFGFTEVGICLIQTFLEFNYLMPDELINKSHKKCCEEFTKYWDCNCRMIGDENGVGWKNCYSKDSHFPSSNNTESTYVIEEDLFCWKAKKENYSISKSWINLEKIREKHNFYPLRKEIDYDNKDPDRIVSFDKVSKFLFKFPTLRDYVFVNICKIFHVDISGLIEEPCLDIDPLLQATKLCFLEDTHPPYEALLFLEEVLKFLHSTFDGRMGEMLSYGIYKTTIRYGINLKKMNIPNKKFVSKLKETFIDVTSTGDVNSRMLKLLSNFDELFNDSQYINGIDIALQNVDIKVLSFIYEPVNNRKELALVKKALFNYCKRFIDKNMVIPLTYFLLNDSLIGIESKHEVSDDLCKLASDRLFYLHEKKYNFFKDWKLDELLYVAGIVMIQRYQYYNNPYESRKVIEYLENNFHFEVVQRMEELFLLQEKIYSLHYLRHPDSFSQECDTYLYECATRYPNFVNLIFLILKRRKYTVFSLNHLLLNDLKMDELSKMIALIYVEYLYYTKHREHAVEIEAQLPSFDKLRNVILKYADKITKMIMNPCVWNLLLYLENEYGTKESIKSTFLKGLDSVGWSKDYYMNYLSYNEDNFQTIFSLFIEKGFRIRCLKEEISVLIC
uniref:RPAP1_C domain-containing protein n=1 Tax=Parastrongyloides trichosuri TaxID=131310 RepID=A0A0N4Z0Q9_PARTI